MSELSHRSHDPLGQAPSPLLSLSLSSSQKRAAGGHKLRRALSEKDFDADIESDAEIQADEEAELEDQSEDGHELGRDLLTGSAIGRSN